MGSSYSFFYWRSIICTPAKAGYLGDNQKNKNLKKSKNKKNNLIHNLITVLSIPVGVGGIIVLFILAGFFGEAGGAKAAISIPENLELARDIINDISPIISEAKVDPSSATLALAPEGYLNKPLVTETQITREETRVQRPVLKTTSQKKSSQTTTLKTAAIGTNAHKFPYGYCTYYVAQKRFIPWSGNAISWLSNARAYGYETGDTPRVGAIVATTEGGATGHVAMVDQVNSDGTITISEMNYRGFGVISSRTISVSYGAIMGYIY